MASDDQQNEIKAVVRRRVQEFPPERLFMYGLVRAVRPAVVIEAGVSDGVGSVVIARALRHNDYGKLIGVDDWSLTHGGLADSADVPRQNLLADGTPRRFFEFHTGDAVEYLRGRPDKSADIVIVDADHGDKPTAAGAWEALRIATRLAIVHDTEILPLVRKACWVTAGRARCGGVFIPSSRGFWIAQPGGSDE